MKKCFGTGLWVCLLLPLLTVPAFAQELIVGGQAVGIQISTAGVLVAGFNDVETAEGLCCPAAEAGLKEGDLITGADGAALPTRPEVYLIPSGLDYMRVPIRSASSATAATRAWQVVDQVLPVPYSLTDSDWDATDWSALKDVCANELFTIRRHPAIRAQVGATFDPSGIVYNARLIGRSVWNDQWYVFIPAASLNADNARARTSFLDAVKDIHFNIKTYSMSGN